MPHSRRALVQEVTRRYSSDLPPPGGMGHRLKIGLSHVLMAIVVRLPIPSEVKWQYSLDFIRTLTLEYYQYLAKRVPEAQARAAVAKALSTAGSRWMWDLAHKHGDSVKSVGAMADMVGLLFRTLNIDSTMELLGNEVVIVNHRCPYLARGLERGIRGERMCDMICGERTSLMEGASLGFPTLVHYRPEAMMGRGDTVCVKRFSDPLHRMR